MKTLFSVPFFFFSLVISTLLYADELYRWVDADGNVSYSSSRQHPKNAESIPVIDIDEKKPDPIKETTKQPEPNGKETSKTPQQKPETTYRTLSIVSPQQDQAVRQNSGNVRIVLDVKPALDKKAGHTIIYTLDGEGKRARSSTVAFSNISRGLHTVQAHIENKKGKLLIKSKIVTFQLHRFSRLNKN